MAVVRNQKYSSGADTSKVGVLEGVHRVQAHSHCGDDHKHHAGEMVDPRKNYNQWETSYKTSTLSYIIFDRDKAKVRNLI